MSNNKSLTLIFFRLVSINLILALFAHCCYSSVEVGGIIMDKARPYHYLETIRYVSVDRIYWNTSEFMDGNNPRLFPESHLGFAVEQSLNLEAKNILRQQIVNRYLNSKSKETHKFNSKELWEEAVNMRIKVIEMMKAMNSNSPSHYAYPLADEKFETDSIFWSKVEGKNLFDQIKGTPAIAIKDLCNFQTRTKGECSGALRACVWYGAVIAIGDERFNTKNNPALLMSDDKNILKNHTKIVSDFSEEALIPGDRVYLQNHNYKEIIKQENGFYERGLLEDRRYFWSGENFLCVGINSEGGLMYEGLGITQRTLSQAKIDFAKKYNDGKRPVNSLNSTASSERLLSQV